MRDQINTQIQTRVSSVYLVMDGVTCLDSGHVVTVHTWCFDQNWYFCVCERVLQFFLDTVWNLDFNIWSQWLWWWLVGVAVGGAEAGLLISDAQTLAHSFTMPGHHLSPAPLLSPDGDTHTQSPESRMLCNHCRQCPCVSALAVSAPRLAARSAVRASEVRGWTRGGRAGEVCGSWMVEL